MVTGMKGDHASNGRAATRFVPVQWVDVTGSTNDDVLEAARGGAPEGLVLVADEQVAGRGRLGRSWQAPAGSSLLVSVLLRPEIEPEMSHLAVSVVALSMRSACQEVAGVTPALKWPNDLLEPDGVRKLGGILAESIVEAGRVTAIVVGVGLNVNWPEQVPEELRGIAVALNHLSPDVAVDRQTLLGSFLGHLERWRRDLESDSGRADIRSEYMSICSTVGREVRVTRVDGGEVRGLASGVDETGGLIVSSLEGTEEVVRAGDVEHLRPDSAQQGTQ